MLFIFILNNKIIQKMFGCFKTIRIFEYNNLKQVDMKTITELQKAYEATNRSIGNLEKAGCKELAEEQRKILKQISEKIFQAKN